MLETFQAVVTSWYGRKMVFFVCVTMCLQLWCVFENRYLSHTWVTCCSRIRQRGRYCAGFHWECRTFCRKTQWFLHLQLCQTQVCDSHLAIWVEGNTGLCLFALYEYVLKKEMKQTLPVNAIYGFYTSQSPEIETRSLLVKIYLLHMWELYHSTFH